MSLSYCFSTRCVTLPIARFMQVLLFFAYIRMWDCHEGVNQKFIRNASEILIANGNLCVYAEGSVRQGAYLIQVRPN